MKYLIICLFLASTAYAGDITDRVVIFKESVLNKDLSTAQTVDYGVYDDVKKELTVTIHDSPKEKCFRLVYDDSLKVIAYFESEGVTSTVYNLFCGTQKECEDEAKRLNLTLPEVANEEVISVDK